MDKIITEKYKLSKVEFTPGMAIFLWLSSIGVLLMGISLAIKYGATMGIISGALITLLAFWVSSKEIQREMNYRREEIK